MIWVALFAVPLVLALVSTGANRTGLLVFAGMIGAVQIGKAALDPVSQWYFSALCAIVAGVIVAAISSGKLWRSALLMVAGGMLVIFGRWFGGAYALGNPLLALSDACGVAAILVLGHSGLAKTATRIGRWSHHFGGGRNRVPAYLAGAKRGREEVGATPRKGAA